MLAAFGARSAAAAVLVLAAATASCGEDFPGELRAQSPHFRLFTTPAAEAALPPSVQHADLLTALETNWSDTATTLAMPDARIDYHLVGTGESAGPCGAEFGGCATGPVVVAPLIPDQHELNHAYLFARTKRFPLPIVAEGMAEAIGCGNSVASAPAATKLVPWMDAVRARPQQSFVPYEQGRILMHHLIASQGIERTLAYYDQAPSGSEPGPFADNFAAFWGFSIDDEWAAMHVVPPGRLIEVLQACPCSLPAAPIDGEPIADQPFDHPYWTLPDAGADTLNLSGQYGVSLMDCAGQTTDLTAYSHILARLPTPLFASLEGTVSRGHWIADVCDEATPFEIPTDGVPDEVSVAVAPPVASASAVYILLRPAAATIHVAADVSAALCSTCAFTDAACPTIPPNTPTAISGDSYLKIGLAVPFPGDGPPDITLRFTP